MSGKRTKKKTAWKPSSTTTKRIAWFILINAVMWVWCSYGLAYLGREKIAEDLSRVAIINIVAVVLIYALKALFEKRPDFGSVGKKDVMPADNQAAGDGTDQI